MQTIYKYTTGREGAASPAGGIEPSVHRAVEPFWILDLALRQSAIGNPARHLSLATALGIGPSNTNILISRWINEPLNR
jgi:hypothetical protein